MTPIKVLWEHQPTKWNDPSYPHDGPGWETKDGTPYNREGWLVAVVYNNTRAMGIVRCGTELLELALTRLSVVEPEPRPSL